MNRFSIYRLATLAVLVLVPAVGCAGKVKVKANVDVGMSQPKKAKKQAPPDEVTPASPSLGVTNDLVEECMLKLRDVSMTPKFDYDESDLLPTDKEVLEAVATCVVSGPLTGRSLQVVGRADPRGTTEYNLGLGTKRANVVAAYLKRVGVPAKQIATTTRGDLDATGRDESSWRTDRRADIELMEDLKVSSR
ncbi:MAG: OmpA family protein [Kofleriaceae bacterium]